MAGKSLHSIPKGRTPMPEQPPEQRRRNFEEVALGYPGEDARREASRCLECKKARCVPGCPVGIDIPAFIRAIDRGDLRKAYEILLRDNPLPAVCGRVCPQETQCEAPCIVGIKDEPVSIGRLERFVADYAMEHFEPEMAPPPPSGRRVAIVGSGPAGLACAADLARAGVAVTIYEALHVPGGVLRYGIPPFRLPTAIVEREIKNLQRLGVTIVCNAVIGKLFTVEQLRAEKGFDAVFIGIGAGTPKFMGIPGEGLNGVFSANEFLTRVNLMQGYRFPEVDTPVGMGRRVAVIGAGNTAMDAARVALRMGAEVAVVYRRTEREAPARREELHHAMEEGVRFLWLTAPVRLLGNADGWMVGMECVRMELGDADASGRRAPVEIPGSNFMLDVDTAIYALGTNANPIIARTTPGLKTNKWGYIQIDERTGMTAVPGVFAGGDIVTGAATVILALGAGRRAARGILEYLGTSAGGQGVGATAQETSGAGRASDAGNPSALAGGLVRDLVAAKPSALGGQPSA
ncbi:MAG TPA: NADPH-dependent glutamate synthase [Candidatus Sulfotelmatobacter sp.]|nr:NADPH-dependent glutamate synthase [Candidatus Sulfotelmatobacter sp.]